MKSFNTYLKKVSQSNPARESEMKFSSWLLELGLNIARLREAKGWSQTDFAKRLNIPQSSVARIESGQNMRFSTIWKVSEVLEVELTIFDTSSILENEKFETFCNASIDKKSILSEEVLQYKAGASSSLGFHFISNKQFSYGK